MSHQYDSHAQYSAKSHDTGPSESAEPLANMPRAPGATIVDTMSGTARTQGVVRSTDVETPVNDFLDTGTSKQGSPLPRAKLTADSVVMYRGMAMRLGGLEDEGIVTKSADGYQIAAPKQAAPVAHVEGPKGEAFSPQVEAVAAEVANRTSIPSQIAIIGDYARNGSVSEASIIRVASEMGIHPDAARAHVTGIVEGFQDQASNRLGRYGNVDEVVAWAKKSAPAEFSRAVEAHAKTRSADVYDSIGKLYLQSYDSTAEGRADILSANLPDGMTATVHGKQVVLNHPSFGEVSWKEAVKRGLVNPNMGEK